MRQETKGSINFQDLMLHRIHEILLVASPYDAFILEEDGRLTQQILYEYLGMNLSYAPRVWHAKNAKIGLKKLAERSYDLVIVMMRIADMDPITFGEKVKKSYPDKPVILLAFDESEISMLPKKRLYKSIDKVYIWSGNANLFPAIIKNIEDKMNIERDYKLAGIRSIVMVEDNPRYYSIILPLIYRTALSHARSLISRSLSDTDRLLLFRARPKILLASNYEEAISIYEKYRHSILGFISDVQFPKNNKLNQNAGLELAKHIRSNDSEMPIVLQSTSAEHEEAAAKTNTTFIHKKSSSLIQDLKSFIVNNFGFGDFIFRYKTGKEITRATNMAEFQKELEVLPKKSLQYHASKNHFSNWIAVRGEFELASKIRKIKISNYNNLNDLRQVLLDNINLQINENKNGKILQYEPKTKTKELSFVRMSTGSLGGKARGLAFASNLLNNKDLENEYPDIIIRVPKIAVIGTDEFDEFMNINKLWKIAFNTKKSDKSIIKAFLKASLSKNLKSTLTNYLNSVKFPIAVRSSSLLEDSQYQPLAGMYSTYMLANKDKSKSVRLGELEKAIKLVYASTFLSEPKTLIEASVHHHEEEKMAVIIMELAGKRHGDIFYPSASGLAQSFNYYPISYMKRNEGVAYLALGLGRTIAEGEKSLRIAPKYPGLIPQYYSVKSTIDNSQNQFYALDLKKGGDLLKNSQYENTSSYSLNKAETDGELFWSGSVVSNSDNKIRDNLKDKGTRVVTFPSLLKWNSAPAMDLIIDLLKIGENALGCPVEIEFAINLNKNQDKKHEFCLLQIKPMVVGGKDLVDNKKKFTKKELFCSSSIALGNGIIKNIKNIIFINPNNFDPSKSKYIAKEIEKINNAIPNGEKYILIGPGRWGSSDPWLGIPVEWSQISKAKVIVEYGMNSFPVDPSFGSHFFQNVTSMRIGYFTIDHKNKMDFIDLDWIKKQKPRKTSKYIDWFELENKLVVSIDGQSGHGKIIKPKNTQKEQMDEQETSGI